MTLGEFLKAINVDEFNVDMEVFVMDDYDILTDDLEYPIKRIERVDNKVIIWIDPL